VALTEIPRSRSLKLRVFGFLISRDRARNVDVVALNRPAELSCGSCHQSMLCQRDHYPSRRLLDVTDVQGRQPPSAEQWSETTEKPLVNASARNHIDTADAVVHWCIAVLSAPMHLPIFGP
jgi:hypothetical protein